MWFQGLVSTAAPGMASPGGRLVQIDCTYICTAGAALSRQRSVAAAAMRAPPPRRALLPLLLLLLLLLPLAARVSASADEARLLSDLLSRYDRRVRPVANHSEPVVVNLGVTVNRVQLHPERNEATANIWVNLKWKDEGLVWDSEEYGGVADTRVPPGELWLPDVMPYNQRPRPESSWLAQTRVVVKSNGELLYVAPASVRFGCRREFFGLDHFICQIKLGSWTYSGFQLDLRIDHSTADLSSYIADDPFWTLSGAPIKRNSVVYDCCPEPYVDVTMELDLQRSSSLSAWPNLPVAVSLLTSLAAFLVPVDSPQKLTLPSLSLLAAGSAVLTEFGLQGNAEYRSHFLRVYHVYTYIALAVLLWSVLMVALGRPRALRLPSCLRRLLTSCLACICCLASPPEPNSKLCYEWTALAELLDRLAFVVFLVLVLAGSTDSSWTTYQ